MGLQYGTIPRKTVPRAEQPTAMDFSILWEFGVSVAPHVQNLVPLNFRSDSMRQNYCHTFSSTDLSNMPQCLQPFSVSSSKAIQKDIEFGTLSSKCKLPTVDFSFVYLLYLFLII